MSERRKTVIKRTIFIVVMLIAMAVLLFWDLVWRSADANYSPENNPVNSLQEAAQPDTESSIAEPEDAYTVMRLTFGGDCTPASMLGSSSYGTFNAMAAEEEPDYFFSRLGWLFQEDDCTVLGCAATFSDNKPEARKKEAGEEVAWYLAPTENAKIFSSSSVDVVSLANSRSNDYGEVGQADTKAALEAEGIAWSNGGKAYYVEKAGVRVGILCASVSPDGDLSGIQAWLETASCAMKILYLERTADSDEFYNNLAKDLIDAGSSVVCYVGGGTEAKSAVYANGIIVNSLGYLLDGNNKFPTENTAVYSLTMTIDDGAILQIDGHLIPIRPYDDPWQPVAETTVKE